jgi:Rhodopirellula transposase DDE domain
MVMMTEEALAEALDAMRPHLNERQRRVVWGALAVAIGPGGIGVVAAAAGAARSTVSIGARQVRERSVPADGRARVKGGGRKPVERTQPGVDDMVDELVDPSTRGDPTSSTRWTTKSARWVAKGLARSGFEVAVSTARKLVRKAGYRLMKLFKTKEAASHPDRDAQFDHINATVAQCLADGEPIISADTKKRELVGEYANNGREWQPTAVPEQVNGHDFPTGVPRAIPYGVYDIGSNEGFVSVGVDHDTAAFAVSSIRQWWYHLGRDRYPTCTTLTVTVDAGGSNGYRPRAWKIELARLAAEIGRDIRVCHYSPGTSKWNKVEHRLFSFISINWRGRPLRDYETVLETIAHTTTDTGLTVTSYLDTNTYPTGVKVSKAEMAAVPIARQPFHGEWNYTILCGRN